MADTNLPPIFEPLLDYLSDHLPPSVLNVVETLLDYSWALTRSLIFLAYTLITTPYSSWNAEKILPPIITLFAAYLALVSFYRTTGWMIRSAFFFVKWGFILSALGAGAGYFLATGGGDGDGLGAFGGGGLVPMIGGYLLDMLNGGNDHQGSRGSTTPDKSRKNKKQTTRKTKSKSQAQQPPRPKAWENWDRHRDWQYNANAQEEKDPATEIQKVVGEVLGAAGRVVKESGWWEAAKGVVNDFSSQAEGQGKGKAGGAQKAKSKSTKSR